MTGRAEGAADRPAPGLDAGPRGECSATSLELEEPAAGTAPQVATWLLIEQPGPWGRKAVTDSRLDPEVGGELKRRADAVDTLRVQLIRRPGGGQGSGGGSPGSGRSPGGGPADGAGWRSGAGWSPLAGPANTGQTPEPGAARTAFVCRPEAGVTLEIPFADEAALLDLDLDAPTLEGMVPERWPAGRARRREAPLYLVCTNGRRDRCCATLGRALVAALADACGEALWETSHVGGHRFAANLVCLPDGTYYGRLDAASGPATVAGHREGRLDLDHLRGRSWLPPPAQAAEIFARRRWGLVGREDVRVEAVRSAGGHRGQAVRSGGSAGLGTEGGAGAGRFAEVRVPGGGRSQGARIPGGEGGDARDGERWEVTLTAAGEPVTVRVERRPTGRARPVSCGGDPEDPGRLICTLEPGGD